MQSRNSVGGRPLGPPTRLSSVSNENLPDVRFSSTKKRSKGRNSNWALKTPNSQSVLRQITNSRTGSTSKKKVGRPSVANDTRVAKDNRPLRDKQWQMEQVKSLLDFLRDNDYPNKELSSKSFPLSANEFRGIFNFLYGILSPSYRLPQKFESEIMVLLKALDYPGVISKSSFVTIGSLHSWPSLLGVLVFIKDIAVYYLERINQVFFFKQDSENNVGSEDVERKLYFEFYVDTYNKFMNGQNEFEEEIKALELQLLHHLDLNPDELKNLIAKRDELKATLDSMKEETGHIDSLKHKIELLNKDYEHLADYKVKYIEYTQKKSTELKNMKKKNEELLEEVKNLGQELSKDGHQDELTCENYENKKSSLNEIYSNINHEIRKVDEDICDIEIKISKLKVKCDTAVRDFNMIIEELDCPTLEKINEVEEFNYDYHSRLIDSVSGIKKDLRQAQHETDESSNRIQKLKADIVSTKNESKNLIQIIDLKKREMQNLERNIKEEEATINAQLLGLKSQLIKLQSQNQPPQINFLLNKVNDLDKIRNQKQEMLEQRIKDVEEFLEKATLLSISFVQKVEAIKSTKIEEHQAAEKASIAKGEKLLKKMEKHLKHLQEKKKSNH